MKRASMMQYSQLCLAAIVIVAAGGVVGPAQAATASANATANVVTPIAIAKTADLVFGSFTTSAAGQTITVSAAGVRSASGAVPMTGATSAAAFNVTGSGALTYAITLPTTVSMITGTGATAAETMAVTGFTSNPSGTGALTAGAQLLAVGGTLTTVAAQVAGAYTGTFNVSVDYN